jgi:hypothetical protein
MIANLSTSFPCPRLVRSVVTRLLILPSRFFVSAFFGFGRSFSRLLVFSSSFGFESDFQRVLEEELGHDGLQLDEKPVLLENAEHGADERSNECHTELYVYHSCANETDIGPAKSRIIHTHGRTIASFPPVSMYLIPGVRY